MEQNVLIINGTAIGEKNGTGVTLQNIWKMYPKDHILQIKVDPFECEYDESIKTVKTPVEFCRFPYKLAISRKKTRDNNGSGSVSLNGNIKQMGIKAIIHDVLRGILDGWRINYKILCKEMGEFRPDVIYTCGSSIRIQKTAIKLSRYYKIPIILHLMDDWPATIYQTSNLSSIFRKNIWRQLKKICKSNNMHFAISPILSEKYSNIFNVKFKPLMNPALSIVDNISSINRECVEFVYAGSLNLNRWKSLLTIAKILCEYKEKGYNNKLKMYVPENMINEQMLSLFEQYNVEVNSFIPADQLRKVYERCDVLVFAESFDANVVEFARYSLSTKIPEYMSTGKIILGFLPAKLYSYTYLNENNVALVASDESELRKKLLYILRDDEICNEIKLNALELAKNDHSLKSVNAKLEDAIENAIECKN